MLPLTGVPDRHHLGMSHRIRSRGDFVHPGPRILPWPSTIRAVNGIPPLPTCRIDRSIAWFTR
jgi:hypothetical protein